MDKKFIKDSIKIKRWHSRNCILEGKQNEYYFPDKMFFGNYAGNEKNFGNHYWIKMICNDPGCEFEAVINTNLLSELIKT